MTARHLNFIFAVVVVLLLGIVGWQYMQANKEINGTATTTQTPPSAATEETDLKLGSKPDSVSKQTVVSEPAGNTDTLGEITMVPSGYIYKNDYYRFQLSMPDSWEGVKVRLTRSSDYSDIRLYSFIVPFSVEAVPVSVSVISKEDFKKRAAGLDDSYLQVLACSKQATVENDRFILCAHNWQDVPDSNPSTKQISDSISAVKASLKFY